MSIFPGSYTDDVNKPDSGIGAHVVLLARDRQCRKGPVTVNFPLHELRHHGHALQVAWQPSQMLPGMLDMAVQGNSGTCIGSA